MRKTIPKLLTLMCLLAALMTIDLMTTAFAAPTIDGNKKASLSIYKYDLTSAPIGGADTNAVIAGHRGWQGADYFHHIDKLAVGDVVTITNLWETLTYEVADIQIIQPHEIEKIKIQQGRDLLTLLTCHPYASGGKQRYVVYCERIKN